MVVIDRYTYLHFAVGIIAFFFNISLVWTIILHVIFEVVENTELGMNFINNYILFWPGGKDKPDPIMNSVGDTFGAIAGWLTAWLIS